MHCFGHFYLRRKVHLNILTSSSVGMKVSSLGLWVPPSMSSRLTSLERLTSIMSSSCFSLVFFSFMDLVGLCYFYELLSLILDFECKWLLRVGRDLYNC